MADRGRIANADGGMGGGIPSRKRPMPQLRHRYRCDATYASPRLCGPYADVAVVRADRRDAGGAVWREEPSLPPHHRRSAAQVATADGTQPHREHLHLPGSPRRQPGADRRRRRAMGTGCRVREGRGMSGRGRRATFPDVHAQRAAADLARIVQASDPRRFRVRVDGGGESATDLSLRPHPGFSAAHAPLLRELIRHMGLAPVRRTVYCKVLDLRRFWRFLDASGDMIGSLDDLTADLINRYEDWLEQNTSSQASLRRLIRPVIPLLRLAVEQTPERFPQSLVNRLNWLGRGEFASSHPRDAYSTGVTAGLQAAPRKQNAEAGKRIPLADKLPDRPVEHEASPVPPPLFDSLTSRNLQ